MNSMLELLRKIEKCPALYIGGKDIHRLRAFLSGYGQDAMLRDDWLWNGFREWLAERYSDTRAFDWASLIAAHEPDGDSTDAFFRLLNEYLAAHPCEDESNFRAMRRTAQQLPREECIDILSTATSGVLALHGDDGYPYAVPISYVADGDSIFFHGAVSGHKADAMRCCDRVSLCVVAQDEVVPETYSTDYRSVIVFGRVSILEDDQRKLEALRKLAVRYAPHNPQSKMDAEISGSFDHTLVAEISIEHITGKHSLRMAKERSAKTE